MKSPKSLSLFAITTAAIIASGVILSTTYLGNQSENNFAEILGFGGNSGSTVGVADAATLPMDVRENFRAIEKTGDGKTKDSSMKINTDFVDPDNHCEFCIRIEFTPGDTGKAGIIMKSDKAFDLSKADRVALFARGESGTEEVQFKVAGKETRGGIDTLGAKKLNFAFTSDSKKLQKDWQKLEIDLSGKDLKAITYGFAFDLGRSDLKNSKEPIVIYLKGMTFDEIPAEKPLREAASN